MEQFAFIDWISITHKRGSNLLPPSIPRNSNVSKGRNGYTSSKTYISGVIEMINPERLDMGIHIVYSGKTLQNLQQKHDLSRDEILQHHTSTGGRVSRVDFAIDLHDSDLSLHQLWRELEDKSAQTLSGHSRTQSGDNKGDTVYVGSRKKRKKMLRMYDKAKEQHDFVSDYKRIELETRQDVARNATKLYQDSGYSPQSIKGMIKKFCDFPEYKTWCDIFDAEALKIPVGTSGDGQTEIWLLEQVAPSLAKVLLFNPEFKERFSRAVSFHMHKLKN